MLRRCAGLLLLVACSPGPTASPEPSPVTAPSVDAGLPALQPEPLPGDPMGVTVHRLENGLTVYLSTDRQRPRFHAWLAVRAGSRHDPADSTGLAHYLEHMLFKGTDELGTTDMAAERPHLERVAALYGDLAAAPDEVERGKILRDIDEATVASAAFAVPNELDRLYATLGVEGVNAFTTDEATVYIGDVPANRGAAWARVEGERFTDPVFRLFLPELEAVYEEKNLSLDDPWDRVIEALLLGLFPRHPYGTQPTIGHAEHLKTPAYADMEAYYRRFYVPNNMAVLLAGDVDAKTVLPLLERSFGRMKPAPLPGSFPGVIEPLTDRVFREVVTEGEESVTIGWHVPGFGHEDEPALVVLDWLADNARTGLLNLELELTQKVPEASSSLALLNEGGYFLVNATARNGQPLEEVERLLMGVIRRLSRGAFTAADVRAVVLHETIAQQRRLESNDGRVARMLEAYLSRRDWPEMLALEEATRGVTRKRVLEVARRVLGEGRVVVYRRRGTPPLPAMEKPRITPVPLDPARGSAFARDVVAMDAPALEPRWLAAGDDYQRRELASGPLVTVANERNRLYTVTHRFQHGYRDEPLLCYALDLLELSGAGARGPEDLQRELYGLGASVAFGCNAEESTIVVSGIDETMDQALGLVREWIESPRLEAETLAGHLRNTLSRRRDHLESSRLLARVLADYANFGPDTAWLDHPSNADLRAATLERLRQVITSWPDREHWTLYLGPRAPGAVADVLTLGQAHAAARPPRARRYRELKRPLVFFLHRDVAKSNIEVLFPRGRTSREGRALATLYSEYLDGNMSSIVTQEIREARGLAYSASAHYTPGRTLGDDGGLIARIATQGDKTEEAIRTFLGLVIDRRPEGDRVEAARAALDERFRGARIDPRDVGDKIWAWDMLGETTDPRPYRWNAIRETSLETLAEYARQASAGPFVVSVLGDRDNVDLPALRKIGKLREMKPAQLFSYGSFPEP